MFCYNVCTELAGTNEKTEKQLVNDYAFSSNFADTYNLSSLRCVRKNSILHITGFLDLPLLIKKIDLSYAIVKEMVKILDVTFARSLFAEVPVHHD